jgi:HK97 family phage major capsid protein
MELKDIAAKIDELEGKAKTLTEQADKSDSADDIKAIQDTVEKEITPQLASLTKERDERLRDIEFKSMQSTMGTLEDAINDLRSGFPVGSTNAGKGVGAGNESPYGDGTHSYFADVKAANKGRTQAFERLTKGIEGLNVEGKAMTEGTGSQGGYLVQTQIERQILDVRELDNVLRDLCSKLNVTTTNIELDQITLGTTAGWVAELATKPEATNLTLATVTATVFTAAGLATISNQLLADSNPAVDGLATRDLAKRLVALEETAFLAGSGTGQPLGILNTPGVNTQPLHHLRLRGICLRRNLGHRSGRHRADADRLRPAFRDSDAPAHVDRDLEGQERIGCLHLRLSPAMASTLRRRFHRLARSTRVLSGRCGASTCSCRTGFRPTSERARTSPA